MCKSPGANCKGYSLSLSAVSSLLLFFCIIFLLVDLGDSLFYLTFSFSEMLTFQSKLCSMSSIFIIIFLCNTLILLLPSSSCLTLCTTPLSPILETVTWTFSSQKSLVLLVPPHGDIFLARTQSDGWRVGDLMKTLNNYVYAVCLYSSLALIPFCKLLSFVIPMC